MKRGLVIGKFLPIHQGHIALIDFAASQCDELIVSMSAALTDTINPEIRLEWLQQIFHGRPNIKCFQITDDFDDDTLPLDFRTKIWAAFIQKTYPPIDVIFSSEEYGEPFARHLKAEHIQFDPPRKQFSVSASGIRSAPFKYWEFIPPEVRPYFVKKLCFFGPESTGKTVMAEILARRYNTVFVPEVARELITSNDFTEDDIVRIGYAQVERISEKLKTANKILFCDTDTITTQLYSKHYLDVIPEVLFVLEKEIKYDHYFLFDIDVAWVADDMRDLRDRRKEMFEVFRNGLEQRRIDYTLVQGDYQTRQQLIESWIEKHYELKPVN